jgi:hypothetical protein
MALPSFLVSVVFLIAFPTTYIPWPPSSLDAALALFAICELFAAGAVVTFLALVWAIAAPTWVADLLETGSRRLVAITGGFMLNTGVTLIGVAISYRHVAIFAIGMAGLIVGACLLWSKVRRSRHRARTDTVSAT